jgi:hypothetical protein
MIAHQQATQHSAPALRRPFDDWLLPTEPSPSPLRHRSPLTCLNNVYASCYSPKLLRARPSPSSDSATQTSPPTHQNNVYASAYAPKPLPQPGFASSYPPKPQCQVVATQTSPPTHRKLTTTTSQPALRPTAITATEVAKQPSACARLALADWSMSADERALRALTAGFTPRAFHVAEGVPYLGIGKVSTKSVSTKHDAQEMSFWMQERSRCKAIAQAAMAAGCVLQKPRSRRWAAAYQEEEAEEETDCKTDGEQSDEATADGEAFVFVGSSIVDAFQNGSAQPGPRSAERTNPLVAMVLAGFDALMMRCVAAGVASYRSAAQCAAGRARAKRRHERNWQAWFGFAALPSQCVARVCALAMPSASCSLREGESVCLCCVFDYTSTSYLSTS